MTFSDFVTNLSITAVDLLSQAHRNTPKNAFCNGLYLYIFRNFLRSCSLILKFPYFPIFSLIFVESDGDFTERRSERCSADVTAEYLPYRSINIFIDNDQEME